MRSRNIMFALFLTCSAVELSGQTAQETEASIDRQLDELRMKRKQAKFKAELASRNADRLLTEDWLGYQREIAREEHFEKEMEELDVKIKILEDQKQKISR